MNTSRELISGPDAFPRESRERICMTSFGEKVKQPFHCRFDFADCLIGLRGVSIGRFKDGG